MMPSCHRRWLSCSQHYRAARLAGVVVVVGATLLLFYQTIHSGRQALCSSCHGYLTTLAPRSAGMVKDLLYVSDPTAAAKLGCPVDNALACFYRFSDWAKELPINQTVATETDCAEVFQPIKPDFGRGWCVRKAREPKWLRAAFPENSRRKMRGPVLLSGELSGPNPTHQANLHFLAIWKWMRRLDLAPGQLSLVVDHHHPDWAPGKFGAGLAQALGNLMWLPQLEPGVVHFEQLQFSIPGQRWPFDLTHRQIDTEVDLTYVELAESIKARVLQSSAGHGGSSVAERSSVSPVSSGETAEVPEVPGAVRQPRVIVAKRQDTDTRIWKNAHEFADHLRAQYNMHADVVTLGSLSFAEQVELVSAADVLVGITGSDLVNLMFLPMTGSVVEIFLMHHGEEMFVPELSNMAALLGKNHFSYVSTGEIIFQDSGGDHRLLVRTKQAVVNIPDLAALVSHAALQARSGSTLELHTCHSTNGYVRCTKPQ